MDQHYLQSSFRESLIEHLFVGEMMKLSWQNRDCALEVAKPEVDNSGYDIILENSRIIRHLQLKTSKREGSTARQKIHVSLGNKPSGCVLWIYFDEHTLDLGPFLFFGGPPGSPLPTMDEFRIAKHTKANAEGIKSERPAHRVVPKGKFAVLDNIVKSMRLSLVKYLRQQIWPPNDRFRGAGKRWALSGKHTTHQHRSSFRAGYLIIDKPL